MPKSLFIGRLDTHTCRSLPESLATKVIKTILQSEATEKVKQLQIKLLLNSLNT